MAQQRVLPQSKETLLQSYNKRLKDDVKSIMDNFTEIIKTAKIEDETQVSRATQGEQDNYEMHVRAANIVRAGESLMKLVSDLKQFLILNDFPSVNEAINQRNQQLRSLQEECDKKLIALRDEISIDLYELEEEYYSSSLLSWVLMLDEMMSHIFVASSFTSDLLTQCAFYLVVHCPSCLESF
ncbi:mediator of RNA polymerase II transcription subunit 22 isoform X3 [Cyrtonyx montezumae]|uniref:mediator of RNA polymerase II transcription subunit 22 isoform X3 n=1 Tax=Cyrtonyx montezumae TaxID=9017 RepID=UPI0032DAC3CE